MGYYPSTLLSADEGWFDFVAAENDLSPSELRVLAACRGWFRELESPVQRGAMVALQAILEAGALVDGLPLEDLCARVRALGLRAPDLLGDGDSTRAGSPDPAPVAELRSWKSRDGRPWFLVEEDRVVFTLGRSPGDAAALEVMTGELVDYWFARDRLRRRQEECGDSFACTVLRNTKDPILKLPSRKKRTDLPPMGMETDVRLSTGDLWRFRFMKEYCNVAHPVGVQRNALPDLLHGWFGLAAGRPGTSFQVRFSRSPEGLWVEPDVTELSPQAPAGMLVYFPTLRAAAGAPSAAVENAPQAALVRLPVTARGTDLFAVRATGDSMNGGKLPIRDGDWLVMRFARAASKEEISGRMALLQVPDADSGFGYQVKRLVRKGKRWVLRSENLDYPSVEATDEIVPIAVLIDVVPPEKIAPPCGEVLADDRLASAFGLDATPRTGRVDGHLFFCIETPGVLVAPDRIKPIVQDRRPGETAFVLTRPPGDANWRYAGVARYDQDSGQWVCTGIGPDVYKVLGTRGSGAPRDM